MSAKRTSRASFLRTVIFIAILLLLILAGTELFSSAWGSGHALGRLSAKWLVVFTVYVVFSALLSLLSFYTIFYPQRRERIARYLFKWRTQLGEWRWPIIVFCSAFPAFFIFYTSLSLLAGVAVRVLVFAVFITVATYLLSPKVLFTWKAFLLVTLSVGSLLALTESFVQVSNYPFALHWSEGNRLWDYSVLFGRTRYNFPARQPIFVWIDPIRQTLWGLPFLIPSVSIWVVRFWSAFITTVPYALLGWFAFRPLLNARGQWLAAGLWALIFLNQGPIYTPLILAAILVAAARQRPILLALPLVFLAGYYAGTGRFTWSFAPAIWSVMLTLSDGVLRHKNLNFRDWFRAGVLGLVGFWIKGLPIALGVLSGLVPGFVGSQSVNNGGGEQGITTLQGLQAATTKQPFLWYRLFPNETYPPGILIGLLLAALPVILLLVYMSRRGFWKTVFWQRIFLVGGAIAFLVVGLVASVKVGGGADLHNMDMFLVTLVLLAGIAWEAGFYKQISKFLRENQYRSVRWLLACMVIIPSFFPLLSGEPLQLPSKERTQFVLQRIQQKIACSRQYGPVLFMDQRQLITFGQVADLPLVVDYEKKYVMDQALAGNQAYFDQFDADLADQKFSLIVSEREGTLYKDLDQESIGDSLVEENNAWIHWVSVPLLTYYESVGDYKDAAVELFMPIERTFDCP